MFKHSPRKRFGQNFLVDQHLIQQIVALFNLDSADLILEIGPGKGALTKHLLNSNAQVTAVEIDKDLSAYLLQKFKDYDNFRLQQQDFLEYDFYLDFNTKIKVIGNLPYNISTPILFKLFASLEQISEIYIMVQLEVAERLLAQPNCKDYGRLSVMAQYFCDIELMLHVPSNAFYPAPKVQSAIVRCVPKISPQVSLSTLREVSTAAFNMRRKIISNSLKNLISNEQLIQLSIDPKLRAENLSVDDFVNIANYINGNLCNW